MLSDVLIPLLDMNGTADPIEDHLAALRLLEGAAGDVDVVVPGHGSVGGADQVRARIELDRAYVHALRDGHVPDDLPNKELFFRVQGINPNLSKDTILRAAGRRK